MFQKFFPPLNSRSKKLRKTCTIYVNHHEGKIMSVFKTVHLFVQGQGQRAPGDGWWCASFNLRQLFQVQSLSPHFYQHVYLFVNQVNFFFHEKKIFFLPCNNDSIPIKALSCLLYEKFLVFHFMVCKYYMFIYC